MSGKSAAALERQARKERARERRRNKDDEDVIVKEEVDVLAEEEEDPTLPIGDDIHVNNFTIYMGGKALFLNSNLTLVRGRRYGLVGYNGSGKSTLLHHIAAREGDFKIPRHIDIHTVEQEAPADDKSALQTVIDADETRTRLLEERDRLQGFDDDESNDRLVRVFERLIEIGADSAEARASAILSGLQFSEEMKQMATREFSGGWRMRIALARALFRAPRLLLLDEPTNHLDLHAVIWLENYLQSWKNTLVIVSHDRDFMTSVCTDILHVWMQKLFHYRGNYTHFERQFEVKVQADRDAYEKQQKRLKALKRAGKITVDITKSGPNDNKTKRDQRAKALSTRKDNKSSKRGGDDDDDDGPGEALLQPVPEYNVKLHFTPAAELNNTVLLKVDEVAFGYPGKELLFEDVSFGVDIDSRIAIVGANGTGKSTLLKLCAGELEPVRGSIQYNPKLRIGVYSQHSMDQLDVSKTPVEHLMEKFGVQYQEARRLLGTIGLPGNVHEHKIGTLSGGQRSRVVLVELQLTKAHILLLDEPTNHLDLETVDALVGALNDFDGGVIVVTHNVSLIEQVCNEIWVCHEDRTVEKFEGDFEDYVDELVEEMEQKELIAVAAAAERKAARSSGK